MGKAFRWFLEQKETRKLDSERSREYADEFLRQDFGSQEEFGQDMQ